MSEQTYPCPSPDDCPFVAETATNYLSTSTQNTQWSSNARTCRIPQRAGREPDQGDGDDS